MPRAQILLFSFRFYQNLQEALSVEKLQNILDPPISQELQEPAHPPQTEKREAEIKAENKTAVYTRRRRRERPAQTDGCHGDSPGSSGEPELDDCLHLFT